MIQLTKSQITDSTKRSPTAATLVAQACAGEQGFADSFKRLKQLMKTSRRGESMLINYARHLAQMTLHFDCLATDPEEDQIEDYLYLVR